VHRTVTKQYYLVTVSYEYLYTPFLQTLRSHVVHRTVTKQYYLVTVSYEYLYTPFLYTASSPSPNPTHTPTLSSELQTTSTFGVTDEPTTDEPTMDDPTMNDPNTLITAVSAGGGGVLVVCALVAVIVMAAVARTKMRKHRKTVDIPDISILQEPPPVSPRGGVSNLM